MPALPAHPDNLKQYPDMFLNYVKHLLGCRTDAQLAKYLDVDKSLMSKVRQGYPINGTHMLRIYDYTGLSMDEQRAILYQLPFHQPMGPIQPAYERFRRNYKLGPRAATIAKRKAEEEEKEKKRQVKLQAIEAKALLPVKPKGKKGPKPRTTENDFAHEPGIIKLPGRLIHRI